MNDFRTGFPALDIVGPASVKDGIMKLSRQQQDEYIALWQQYLDEGHSVLKFVPASGAASRMFKNLFEYLDNGEDNAFMQEFFAGKEKFAFAPELEGKEGREAVRYLLEDMNYGKLHRRRHYKFRTINI